MRSHPPTLITRARRAIVDHALFPRGSRAILAVSGGRDSMALVDVLARLSESGGFTLVAHGVDHGLRAAASDELDRAARLCEARGVAFARTRVDVAPGGNVQARARAARYRALEEAARASSCDRIATAHHADDRAETVLLRLLRGAGPRGLAVLAPLSDGENGIRRARPFITARRADIDAHVARHAIAYADDPSNADPRYLRARVRAELLPLMESLSPGVVDHLNALADQLAVEPRSSVGSALPRATQNALAALFQRPSRARVALPGGVDAVIVGAAVRRRRIPSPPDKS